MEASAIAALCADARPRASSGLKHEAPVAQVRSSVCVTPGSPWAEEEAQVKKRKEERATPLRAVRRESCSARREHGAT
jgi:hypothetical protein